jgi:Domain of unknown function (DUF4352)
VKNKLTVWRYNMVNAKVKLILLFVILVGILLSGCTGQGENSAQESNPTQINTPAPVNTAPDTRAILIKHSATTIDSIGEFNKAPAGKTYLIITMDIENRGYDKFSTNPLYWEIDTNKRSYSTSMVSYSLKNRLDSVKLYDGGKITGSIAFEVPAGTKEYNLRYNAPGSSYKIIENPT